MCFCYYFFFARERVCLFCTVGKTCQIMNETCRLQLLGKGLEVYLNLTFYLFGNFYLFKRSFFYYIFGGRTAIKRVRAAFSAFVWSCLFYAKQKWKSLANENMGNWKAFCKRKIKNSNFHNPPFQMIKRGSYTLRKSITETEF